MFDKATWEQFPCQQCGASLHYSPGNRALSCGYCGHSNPIPEIDLRVQELDYEATISDIDHAEDVRTELTARCNECGSEYRMPEDTHADHCDFCGSPIVIEPHEHRQLSPQGILPFEVEQKQADQAFGQWLGNRWLAPNALKKHARGESHLQGFYIPYWTFDSDAGAVYQGQRGTYYQVPQKVMVTVNGRTQWQTRMVTKVRWTPVRGQVKRFFDDVLVVGTRTLPRKILRKLRTWNLSRLKPYQPAWLSGFRSELYQVQPQEGHREAVTIMDNVLRNDVVRDIGGDQQRITHMKCWHHDVHFKHVLLPVWVAAYRFRGKSYRFVVNGQTGEVQGEYPLSAWKIALLVLLGVVVLAGGLWLVESGYLDQFLSQGYVTTYPARY